MQAAASFRQRRGVLGVVSAGLCWAAVLLWIGASAGLCGPITIPVTAPDGTQVGTINVSESPDGTGVVGGFTSTYPSPPPEDAQPSLEGAAEKCGEDHFNWFQVVVQDNDPPNDADGDPVEPPYIDPPDGGYEGHWADDDPWYWDEGDDPPPGTEGFEDGYNLEDNLEDENGDGVDDTLGYQDFPWGPVGTSLEFVTFLVSLNADGSLHSFHGGFNWTWERINPGVANVMGPLDPSVAWGFYNSLAVPEPASALLGLSGIVLMITFVRRRPRR